MYEEQDEQPVTQQRGRRAPGNIPRGRMNTIAIVAACTMMMAMLVGKLVFNSGRKDKTSYQEMPRPTSADTIGQNTKAFQSAAKTIADLKAETERLRAEADKKELDQLNAQQGQSPLYSPAYGYQGQPQTPVDPVEDARKKRLIEMEQLEYKARMSSPSAFSLAPEREEREVPRPVAEYRKTILPKEQPSASKPGEKQEVDPSNTLQAGTVIQCILANRLGGLFTGPVKCQVSTDVLSQDASRILIPEGSVLLGKAHNVTMQNQDRLALVFRRLITEDFSMTLGDEPGLDQLGEAGVKDKVNHHYASTLLRSGILGVLSGLSLAGTGGYYSGDGVDMARQGMSRELAQEARQIFGSGLNRMPTVTIREGTPITIMLQTDLVFPETKL